MQTGLPVRDQRRQVIHSLHLFRLFPKPAADLSFPFIEGEAIQGQKRPDHVLEKSSLKFTLVKVPLGGAGFLGLNTTSTPLTVLTLIFSALPRL